MKVNEAAGLETLGSTSSAAAVKFLKKIVCRKFFESRRKFYVKSNFKDVAALQNYFVLEIINLVS